MLHGEGISSFLVTNAQFPGIVLFLLRGFSLLFCVDRIKHVDPVTQLYVSIDAATQESLKAIDRPLFKDFWERYLGSLQVRSLDR